MRKLLIGVAVLAVLLVAADRISVAVAENQISDRLTSAYGLPGGFRAHPDGKNLSVSGRLAFHGVHIPVTATVAVGVSDSGIRVSPVRVDVPGLGGVPVSAYSSQLHIVVPLSTLPLHLHLTSVHVTPDGLRIAASARHVQFARG